MSFKADVDMYFILVSGVAGMGLFGFSASSFKHLTSQCKSKTVRDGLTVIMTLGAILSTMALCYVLCVKPWSKRPKCYSGEPGIETVNTYLSIMGISCLLLTVLLILMIVEYNKNKECKHKDLTFNLYFMLGMAIVGMFLTFGPLVYDLYLMESVGIGPDDSDDIGDSDDLSSFGQRSSKRLNPFDDDDD